MQRLTSSTDVLTGSADEREGAATQPGSDGGVGVAGRRARRRESREAGGESDVRGGGESEFEEGCAEEEEGGGVDREVLHVASTARDGPARG